ncbi:MAG TPA: hypothetical protein VKY31_11960 [Terriglobia bacterium]|nr:hypothetical protein [Terriglobia bacterium]
MTKATLQGTDKLAQTVAALARLLDQTMNDIQALDSEVQEQVAERLHEAAGEWEHERAALIAECERARDLVEQARQEHRQALLDTDEAAAIALERQIAGAVERVRTELTAQWEADRATLVADRNRAQQRLADVAAEYEKRLAEAGSNEPATENGGIKTEIARVEEAIHAISQIVENPETELSVVIRKNVERAELESYLRGLRFKGAAK